MAGDAVGLPHIPLLRGKTRIGSSNILSPKPVILRSEDGKIKSIYGENRKEIIKKADIFLDILDKRIL